MGRIILLKGREKEDVGLYDAYGRSLKGRRVKLLDPRTFKPFEKLRVIKPETMRFLVAPEDRVAPATLQEALWLMKKVRSEAGRRKPSLEQVEEMIGQLFSDRIEKTRQLTLPKNPLLRDRVVERWGGFRKEWVKSLAVQVHQMYFSKVEKAYDEEIKRFEERLKK